MSSPIVKSPLKSIANYVKRALDWSSPLKSAGEDGAPAKELKIRLKRVNPPSSRSVSPEFPKVEEPAQYVLCDEFDENEKPEAARSTRGKRKKLHQQEESSGPDSKRARTMTPKRPTRAVNAAQASSLMKNQTPRQNEATPRKSARSATKAKKSYKEEVNEEAKFSTPSKASRTPKRSTKKSTAIVSDSDIEEMKSSSEESEEESITRSSKRKKTIQPSRKAATPSCHRKRTKKMTPRIPDRCIPIANDISSLEEAQLRLHVAAVPDSLPCREEEFAEILSFTEGKIFDGTGGCMYISGVPGTGKTATVKEVIRTLQGYSDAGDLPNFRFIEINGMRLTEPNQTYVQLWKALTGAKVTTEHAKNLLEKRFVGANSASAKKTETTVVLVDELDLLWNRKQSVLYNIFEWPTNKFAKLVVLAIANTMDLPERVMINRVSSRIGLTRLTFSPYTHQQLQEIVTARLEGLAVFDKDAIQLVSRKVASLSGDARRALDICRRAVEIAQRQKDKSLVGIVHVTEAHKEMFCSPKIMAIRCCSKYEKVLMQAMVGVFQKTGIEEALFDRVFKTMNEILAFEGLPACVVDEAHNVAGRLSACRLILTEPGKTGRLDMKLRLNVAQDDILFALRDEQ